MSVFVYIQNTTKNKVFPTIFFLTQLSCIVSSGYFFNILCFSLDQFFIVVSCLFEKK